MVTAIEGVGYRGKIADNDRNRFCINAKTSSVYFFIDPRRRTNSNLLFFSSCPRSVAFLFHEERGRGEGEHVTRLV